MHRIDLGLEAQRENVLLYGKYQIGLLWLGTSVNPVLE
jgi:hypothetical protein